jgi:hypothetical protein
MTNLELEDYCRRFRERFTLEQRLKMLAIYEEIEPERRRIAKQFAELKRQAKDKSC